MNHIRLVDSDWLLTELLKETQLCAQDKGSHRYGEMLENLNDFPGSGEVVGLMRQNPQEATGEEVAAAERDKTQNEFKQRGEIHGQA